ncbi:MAG TPA: hypothetical protein VJR89_13295 [Polyangiales bacterium]|nr:hypothetical protein [Polyangiales bacterium]
MTHTKSTWVCVLVSAWVFAACGDDDEPSDAGGDAAHGEHDKEDSGKAEDGGADEDDAGTKPGMLSFFVASDTSKTGKLGGLKGADERCNKLAKAAGSTRKFAAYLSAEKNEAGEDEPVNARDRIGKGPWYNAKGVLLAKDVNALHALPGGNADLFLTEKGGKINGQWEGSPSPNEHDILTGSDAEGKVMAGKTCSDWTSDESGKVARVGHSDGLGPNRNPAPPYNSWNSSHDNLGCNDTAPAGGAGHIYCFAVE